MEANKEKLRLLRALPFYISVHLLQQAFNAPGNEKANLFRPASVYVQWNKNFEPKNQFF